MPEENLLEIEPGVDLHYLDKGSGRPIIFIPGWMFSADLFEKQIDYYAQRYRVIAIDPRNHGKSSISPTGNLYRQQGEDLGKIINHLTLRDIILVGWSFGGQAVWAYLEQQGLSNVQAVINIDVSPRSLSADPTEWTAGTLENLIDAHKSSLDTNRHYRKFMSDFADTLLLDRKPTDIEKAKFIGSSLRIPSWIADALYVDGWLADRYKIAKAVDEALPSLMFVAKYRAKIGVPYIKKEFPHTEVHSFGQHMMFWQYPEKFNTIVDDFLAAHHL